MMAMPELVPMRVAPAASSARLLPACAPPPEAFTPMAGPTASRSRRTSLTVAPPGRNRWSLYKMGAALLARRQASSFSASLSRPVSRITFTVRPAAASTTAATSALT